VSQYFPPDKSVIVVAHPDDEILWFSSILDHVDTIVICFLSVESQPLWTVGREKSRVEYPLDNVVWLEIPESEAFDAADWQNPVTTPYGLEADNTRYVRNYSILKKRLSDLLQGVKTVYTHNPWGEYGHEEHVQIYRVLKEIQKDVMYDLWFSNYCSNKSLAFMQANEYVFNAEQITLKTNIPTAVDIKSLYQKNGCWTWYDKWVWSDRETFILDYDSDAHVKTAGTMMPINLVQVGMPRTPPEKKGVVELSIKKLRSFGKKLLK
jgi:hypothetical protein